MKGTRTSQANRLLAYLRDQPGASSWELTRDLRVINTTGRISDLRKAGYVIECRRDAHGVERYFLIDPQPLTVGQQMTLDSMFGPYG